jgi:hypothetical protein
MGARGSRKSTHERTFIEIKLNKEQKQKQKQTKSKNDGED